MKVPKHFERRPQRESTIWRFGPLAIHEAQREVFWQGRRLDLSPTEFATLAYLARRAGQVVSYDELLQAVWGISLEQGGTLDQVRSTIKGLRRKLGETPGNPRCLVNVWGVGYRLDLPSEALQAQPFRLLLPSKSVSIVKLLAIVGLTLVMAGLLWGQLPSGGPCAPAWYRGHQIPAPVLVPVVLDRVRYEPEEFNRIHQELHSRGVYLIFTVDPQSGDLLAFSTEGGYNEWIAKRGLPPCESRPTGERVGRVVIRGNVTYVFPSDDSDSCLQPKQEGSNAHPLQACPPPDSYWSRNWEHINCGSASLWVAPNVAILDLRDVYGENWNDKISSAQAATGIYRERLWEHINCGGDVLDVWSGWTYPDLRVYGWNDRASSLWTQP